MRLSENSTVWAGYTRIQTDLADNVSISEDRYWQQWSWRVPWCEALTCALRARLEQRSIEGLPDRLHRFRLRAEFSRRFDWSGNVRWLASPQVRRALLGNRRLTAAMIDKVLRATPKHELNLVPKQTAYPSPVREATRRILKRV